MRDLKIKFTQNKGQKQTQIEEMLNFQIINMKHDENLYPCKFEQPKDIEQLSVLFNKL